MTGASQGVDAPQPPEAPQAFDVPRNPTAERAQPVDRAARPDIRLGADPRKVVQLSRKAVGTLSVVTLAALGGVLAYATQKHDKAPPSNLIATGSSVKTGALDTAPKDYSDVPKLGPPLPADLGAAILAAQRRGGVADPSPVDTQAPLADTNVAANSANAARERASQERTAAQGSRLFLGRDGQGSTALSQSQPLGQTADIASGQAALQSAAANETTNQNAVPANSAQASQTGKRAFLNDTAGARAVSLEAVTAPASPYIVQAGTVIPAALITGIRSDLPGQITAQVTQNVYDSPTGRILLIPQGARLIGTYDSDVSFGQSRVLLAWDRLILPRGRSILLERQPGSDASGFVGVKDGVNFHIGGLFKAALISTILGIGAELGSASDTNLTRAIRRGTQDSVNEAGQQVVKQQLNVQPTLTIRPGFPMRVIVTRDIILTPQP